MFILALSQITIVLQGLLPPSFFVSFQIGLIFVKTAVFSLSFFNKIPVGGQTPPVLSKTNAVAHSSINFSIFENKLGRSTSHCFV